MMPKKTAREIATQHIGLAIHEDTERMNRRALEESVAFELFAYRMALRGLREKGNVRDFESEALRVVRDHSMARREALDRVTSIIGDYEAALTEAGTGL